MNRFLMVKDIGGYNGFGLPPADLLSYYHGILVAGEPQVITVPIPPDSNTNQVLAIFYFSPGSSTWVGYNVVAVPPLGAFSLANCEGNPTARNVLGGSSISFATNDASNEVGVIFYAL